MSESAKERLLGLTRISLAYERAALLALEAAAEVAKEAMTGQHCPLDAIRALAEEVKRGG
jgi:hypothetical protein